MTTLRTAAQQALIEIANARDYIWLLDEGGTGVSEEEMLKNIAKIITTLKAALADPVQEPVAWRYSVQPQVLGASYWAFSETKDVPDAQPLYTAPPHPKPLTEEEIGIICASLGFAQISPVEVARAIERAHGIGGQP